MDNNDSCNGIALMPKTVAKPKPAAPAAAPAYDVQWGLKFDPRMPELNRRMIAARWNRGLVSQYEHRKAIMERLWGNNPDIYEMHQWSDRRLKSICDNVFVIWMGPGSSGKTRDAAAIAMEYWLEDPGNTAVMVCSTTKDMLRKRIWGDICTLWHALPQADYKGVLTDTNCMIRWRDNDMKNGIFGLAVADGPVEDAINNLVGIHTKRVFLILDEMQGVNEAIMGALPNMVKNPEFRFLGMGNPTSILSMLCKFATPLGGWQAVVECETPDWPIDGQPCIGTARAYFFDGRKCPAVVDPEWGKKRPQLLQKWQVDSHIAQRGENDPAVRTQTIGWPPSVGTDNTVLDISIIEKFHCREPAHWTDGFTEMAALDPSFTEAGDNKILQIFRIGLVNDLQGHRWVIEFREWFEVPLDTKHKDDPPEYQILRFCREKCDSKGIQANQFGTDSTGTGMGLASIMRKEWGEIKGIQFGGAASDEIVEESGKKGRDVFDRRSSELNIMVRNFANANGIRGLTQPAEREFCARLTTMKFKHIVETKKDVKKRLGYSPGNSDACCIAVDMARQMGAFPGRSGPAIEVREQDVARKQYESDQRFTESASAQEDDWNEFAMTML